MATGGAGRWGNRGPTATIQDVRILVVDDSPPVRARLCAMLGDLGVGAPPVEIDEASDGTMGLALFDRCTHDVVVLDLHLPGISGMEVLAMMRARRPTPRAPVVIVLTNGATQHHRRACLAAGADYFFDKSSEFERVCEVVAELVRTDRRADVTAASHPGVTAPGDDEGNTPT